MAVDGDLVLSGILVPIWQWFTCMALVEWALDILVPQAIHGSDVQRTPYGAFIMACL